MATAAVIQVVSSIPSALAYARAGETTTGPTTLRDDQTVQALLDALDDADCRRILEATTDAALSASEIAEGCDLPLSTTYRKLDRLTDGGLLEASTRIHLGGRHASEYTRRVDDLVVSFDAVEGIEFQVSYRPAVAGTAGVGA